MVVQNGRRSGRGFTRYFPLVVAAAFTCFSAAAAQVCNGTVASVSDVVDLQRSLTSCEELYVDWQGHIVLDSTITVPSGAVLTVTASSESAIVDGAGAVRLFKVNGGTLNLVELTLTGGNSSDGGGGVYVCDGNVTMESCSFTDNVAGGNGGGVYVSDGSSATVESCTFTDNSASYGGAVYVGNGSTLSANDVLFASNIIRQSNESQGGGAGGAIYTNYSIVIVTASTFQANRASPNSNSTFIISKDGNPCLGGAIFASNSDLNVTDSSFSSNNATSGAAIAAIENSRFVILRSVFTENVAGPPYQDGDSKELDKVSTYGAAVYVVLPGSPAVIDNCHFEANMARYGATVYFAQRYAAPLNPGLGDTAFSLGCDNIGEPPSRSILTINRSNFTANIAAGAYYANSGALLMERGILELRAMDCVFRDNIAPNGGAVQLQADTSCPFRNNSSIENATAVFTRCQFVNNTATAKTGDVAAVPRGGGVFTTWAHTGRLVLRECLLANNSAAGFLAGGVGRFDGPDVSWDNTNFAIEAIDSNFSSNSAGLDGGCFYIAAPGYKTSFSGCLLDENAAGGAGGVVYVVSNAPIDFSDSTMTANRALGKGGVAAMLPAGGGSNLTGSGNYVADNHASGGGSAIFAQNVELQLSAWQFLDNNSPGGWQIELVGSKLTASGMLVGREAAEEGGAAVQVSSNSTLACTNCTFRGFEGGDAVVTVTDDSTLQLDSCRFDAVSASTLVSGFSEGGIQRSSAVCLVRNAVLGDSPYAAAGYDGSAFLSGSLAVAGCGSKPCGAAGSLCVDRGDFGVLCDRCYGDTVNASGASCLSKEGALSVKLADDNATPLWSGASASSTPTRYLELSFDDGSDAITGSSGGATWMLTQSSKDKMRWVFQPSFGLLRHGERVTVKAIAAYDKLSKVPQGPHTSTFIIATAAPGGAQTTADVAAAAAGAAARASVTNHSLTVETSYYFCEGGQFQYNDSCNSCASDLADGSLAEGVNCDAKHGYALDSLPIRPGFWRPALNSTVIVQCYNSAACRGSPDMDAGGAVPLVDSDGYCDEGYMGPYCAVCAPGYASSGISFTCTGCNEGRRSAVAVLLAVAASLVAVLVATAFAAPLGPDSMRDGCCGSGLQFPVLAAVGNAAARAGNFVAKFPLEKLKIPVVTGQILTQYALITSVQFPNMYQNFIVVLNILNFDLSWVVSAGCVWPGANFYDRLLVVTLSPVVLILVGGSLYWLWRRRRAMVAWRRSGSRGDAHPEREVPASSCFLRVAVLVVFLAYSSVSTAVFGTFSCEYIANSEHGWYLRADYSIQCYDWRYDAYRIYAGIMIAVYPLGTPCLFLYLLWRGRKTVQAAAPLPRRSSGSGAAFTRPPSASFYSSRSMHLQHSQMVRAPSSGSSWQDMGGSTGAAAAPAASRASKPPILHLKYLWKAYRPTRYYFEVLECARRLLMTGMLVFVAARDQPAFACLFAAAFLVLYAVLKPFRDASESQFYCAGLAIVFLSVFLSLVVSVDVTSTSGVNGSATAAVIVSLVVLLWAAIIWQVTVYCIGVRQGSLAEPIESHHPVMRTGSATTVLASEGPSSMEEAKVAPSCNAEISKSATARPRSAPSRALARALPSLSNLAETVATRAHSFGRSDGGSGAGTRTERFGRSATAAVGPAASSRDAESVRRGPAAGSASGPASGGGAGQREEEKWEEEPYEGKK